MDDHRIEMYQVMHQPRSQLRILLPCTICFSEGMYDKIIGLQKFRLWVIGTNNYIFALKRC